MKDIQDLYTGGTGSTIETAVIINTDSYAIGVPAEYEYIKNIHGVHGEDYSLLKQSLSFVNENSYDEILIKLKNGEEISYFFNISQFFGTDISL